MLTLCCLDLPCHRLAHVVLPKEQKEKIMSAVTSYTAFKAFKKRKAIERQQLQEEAGRKLSASSSSTSAAGGGGGHHDQPGGDLSDVVAGLVFLFSGPSGTGKTMTVNAIADVMKKRVLLVNFNAMVSSSSRNAGSSSGGGGAVQSLFREASMHDAIVFFDECESLFAQRGTGGSSQLTELLTEIERHDGMIFLATNRPVTHFIGVPPRITAVSI